MPPPDKTSEKKKIKKAQKAVQLEVTKLGKTTQKKTVEANALAKEKAELAKLKKPGSEEKKRSKILDLRIKAIETTCDSEAKATAKRITGLLKSYVPDDKDALPMWQKEIDKWYLDRLKKEPGFGVGGGARMSGKISLDKKEAFINIHWKK